MFQFQYNKIILEVYSDWYENCNFCVNTGKSSMFTFKVHMIRKLQMKTNQQIKWHHSHYIFNSPPLHLAFLSDNVFLHFHIITEEPDQHVPADRFTAQNVR